MNEFKLQILEADGEFYNGTCVSMQVPLADGSKGILANHVNMIAAIVPGELSYKTSEEEDYNIVSVANGVVKIENNEVLILTDALERIEDIDVNRAREKAKEAQEELRGKQSIQEHKQAELRLYRAINRMKLNAKYK